MSCQSTTRAQEDPYAFTESAPLQANSLAYANHSSAVSTSSNSNNATTTSTTIQSASSGASLLLTTTSTVGNVSKDKLVTVTTPVSSSPATLKVRYNGVVAAAGSPTTGTTVVRAPIPVFTKPVQIRQQQPGQTSQAPVAQAQPTITVGKLIKKVLPQQKAPMITTVVAGGTKIISRLQPSSQVGLAGQHQQLQPVISTAGGSVLKFIKIPPQQLAKGTAAGGSIPQGSFIQVTATGEGGARKLIVNSSSAGSNGVSPTFSVATSGARIATVSSAAVSRNVAGVTVVPNLPAAGPPTKIRLIQPQQMQGKLFLQTSNSGAVGATTQISTPVSVATLRNTLVKQQQQLQSSQQQVQQPQIVQQKPTLQQQQTPPAPKQPQLVQQALQQQQKQQQPQQQQPQKVTPSQAQPILQKQQTTVPQLKQKQILNIQSMQSLPQTVSKTTSQQQQQPPTKPQPLVQPQTFQSRENADTTQKLLKQPIQSPTTTQQQPHPQQVVSKTPVQQNVPKQSLLLQQPQPQPQTPQPPTKQTPSSTVQSVPGKSQQQQMPPQSLLLQAQRKQQPSVVSPSTKARPPVQQPQKPVTSVAPVSLLTSSVVTTKGGSLLVKLNEPMVGKSLKDNAARTPVAGQDVRRMVQQQQSLLVASSSSVVSSTTPSPKSRDQSPTTNYGEKIIRSASVPTVPGVVESKVVTVTTKKDTVDSNESRPVTGESKPNAQTAFPELIAHRVKLVDSLSSTNVNGKGRQATGRKASISGKTTSKSQKQSKKRTYSQHSLEEQSRARTSSMEGNGTLGDIGASSLSSSTPNASPELQSADSNPAASLRLSSIKLEQDFEIKQEAVEPDDEKPLKLQRFVAPSVPGAVVVPSCRPRVKEWHAPGAYLFDLKDPGDESDDDAYDEYPNTLSFWYEESIAITESNSSWGMNPMQRGTSGGGGGMRGGKNKSARRLQDAKFQIRMLSRDEQLELKKAYLQRRAVQCRNGLRMRSIAASATKKRLEALAMVVGKLDKRRQAELNRESVKTRCAHEGCSNSALVMTAYCYDHITEDTEQCLFQRCTAKFSDNSQCRVPVFDVSHELILCKEHAWKHDNHDKMSQEVKMHKKPTPAIAAVVQVTAPTPPLPPPPPATPSAIAAGRKKPKPPSQPSVVVRTQKRPKKKKKLTPLQQQMLLHQQQYKQQFAMLHNHHQSNQGQHAKSATPAVVQPTEKKAAVQQQQQRSLLNSSYSNGGKGPGQVKVLPIAVQKAPPAPSRQHVVPNGDSKSPAKFVPNQNVPAQVTTPLNRQPHIPSTVGGIAGSPVYRVQPNKVTAKIVEQVEHDHDQQHLSQQQGNVAPSVPVTFNASANTQDLLTICENSSAYASSEDTGVGGLSESELLATQDVIEEIIPFEFGNLLHPNVLNHLPQEALNELLYLGGVEAEDDTGDSHESCPREVEDDIERALEHVKSLDDMAVEPSSLLGDFLDNVDDEMLDGSDICTTEQILQPANKNGEIRGMVHT